MKDYCHNFVILKIGEFNNHNIVSSTDAAKVKLENKGDLSFFAKQDDVVRLSLFSPLLWS